MRLSMVWFNAAVYADASSGVPPEGRSLSFSFHKLLPRPTQKSNKCLNATSCFTILKNASEKQVIPTHLLATYVFEKKRIPPDFAKLTNNGTSMTFGGDLIDENTAVVCCLNHVFTFGSSPGAWACNQFIKSTEALMLDWSRISFPILQQSNVSKGNRAWA